MSEEGPHVTSLKAFLPGHVVTFNSGEGPDSVLMGLTIEDGSAGNGGGIFCDGSSPTIENNIITGNTSTGTGYSQGGAGIFCSAGAATLITDNIIVENNAGPGSQIYVGTSS